MAADNDPTIDELAKQFPQMTVEQKLRGLRNDALGLIFRLGSVAALLGTIDVENAKGLPEDFSEWIKLLDETTHDLRKTLDRYTTE